MIAIYLIGTILSLLMYGMILERRPSLWSAYVMCLIALSSWMGILAMLVANKTIFGKWWNI